MSADSPLPTAARSPAFLRLWHFIRSEMRMSHIYQPAMLIELMRSRGQATQEAIARSLLARDRSQIDYYKRIVGEMVGRVLTKNRRITEKQDDIYKVVDFAELSLHEVDTLVSECEAKIRDYLEQRNDPWSHRRKSAGYISGTIRYDVLKRAAFRCELCGISAEAKAIEVDHIVPRNHGGRDDPSNFQALCYSCNASKQDRDATDFRGVRDRYSERSGDCPFCQMVEGRVIAANELCYAIRDGFPVTLHHTLIIPHRHVASYFDLFRPELNAIHTMIDLVRNEICRLDPGVTGFNMGTNAGEDAGQTIFHCHVHLIPRRRGDMENPRGGVRGVIPEKRIY